MQVTKIWGWENSSLKFGSENLENRAAERALSSQLNKFNSSDSNGNKAKVNRVVTNSDSSMGQMQILADDILKITLEPPQNQLEFWGFQENIKSTGEEVMIVKHFAEVLIDLAWKCDLGDKGGKLFCIFHDLRVSFENIYSCFADFW